MKPAMQSMIAIFEIGVVIVGSWHMFKNRLSNRLSEKKSEMNESIAKRYHKLFIAIGLILVLIAASPVLGFIVSIPTGREFFSELWILGPEHKAEGYPFSVRIDETQGPVYIAVRNHLGYSAYYHIYVKLHNLTQPSANRTMPSPLDPIFEFQFVLSDRELWKKSLVFSFHGEPSSIHSVSINGEVLPITAFSEWNWERNGFYYHLLFELWLYDVTLGDFQYHDRFVGLWLNMTSS